MVPPARSTLAQVAERAGVSLKTASRALGGEPYVREETRRAVLDAARVLGYQRNAAASLLARRRVSESIGLITGNFTNPFYSALAQGLEDAVSAEGLLLSVANSGEDADREWELARNLGEHQSKALVVASAMEDHSPYAALQATGSPVLFVDRAAHGLDADSVVFDNESGGREAARHLIALGHRRIAFVGDYEWMPTQRDRLAGIGAELEQVGVMDWQRWSRLGVHDSETAREHTAHLLRGSDAPSAIIAGNNRILLGVVEELLGHRGGTLPATIGFDDVEWARALGQTVIAEDPVEMGRRAGALVLERLLDPARPTRTEVLPVTLVARGSGERHPV